MLTPNPFSLFCAILVCLPLALVFTLSSNSSTLTTTLHHPHLTIPLLPPPPSSPPPPPLPSPPPPPSPPPQPPIEPNFTINPTKTLLPKNTTNDQTNTTTSNSTKYPLPTPPQPPKEPSPPPPLPPPPEDDKDDVELLKRASRVNPDPVGGPRKVAFLFLTTTPLPFAPLWETFFKQNTQTNHNRYNIYIHTDPRLLLNITPPSFTGVFSGRVISNSKPTRRNTPTLISAARRLLAHALLDDPDNYMFTLLSAACVPLHSFDFTYDTLTKSNKSFIEILSNETTAYGRWAARGVEAMLPEVPLEVFRIGSQFWSLTRRHARVVVDDVALWRKFRLPCVTLGACFPEENYFPTLLSMVDTRGVVPATLTHVNWRGSHNGHPRTYNASEVDPGLIQWLREGRPRYGDLGIRINGSDGSRVDPRRDPFLFARKFAPNCVEPLLSLANDVLFKD